MIEQGPRSTNRKDWPHRRVVAMHSSASVTGSFCQSRVLKAIIRTDKEVGFRRLEWNTIARDWRVGGLGFSDAMQIAAPKIVLTRLTPQKFQQPRNFESCAGMFSRLTYED